MPLTLILSPATLIDGESDVPITSYYRFVADSNAMPNSGTSKARFSHLPANHLLTLRMDVPEPWDVQQSLAVQDTDNLRCDLQAGCGDDARLHTSDLGIPESQHLTRVEYGLSGLLFFGQCYEQGKSQTAGLQLTLSKSTNSGVEKSSEREMEVGIDGSTSESDVEEIDVPSVYSDTLVMKTVGYWQLRAHPGVWTLKLAEGSRGAEIFEMVEGSVKGGRVSIDKESIGNNSTSKTLVMKDFVSRSEFLLVNRRPGYEETSVFFDKDHSKVTQDQDEEEDVVHVFSLATGHLYERFLKIMMLSVTKRTSTKVKFWLFENYLSPTFKASAREMAERIGCEVEFVTYKWPGWLRAQSEKQRIIWGYKILFLDVLFPLNVKKIIYVDADQVVRGDLKELWDMDLEGAAYGYTPFCTSREATLGYQFWREGFWKRHLRGKPYHISALYVVDLETFRRNLVGDKLRSTYQQLSADPNSLSNLDQDLPNYAQHDVPIFSLPQEWLWCESWCSDETKATAKTIDLCNNPMHKEPKVSMAMRVISGGLFNESWVELDAEVESYDQEYAQSISTKM
jgi:UDP-glucose:glycoprotein glucosyltransferase